MYSVWFVCMLHISQTGSSRSPFSSSRPWKGRDQPWPRDATGQNDNDWEYQWIQTADEYWYKTLHWNMMTWLMCLDMFRTILRKSEARVAHPETSTVKKWQRCDLCMRRWTRVFEGDSRTFFIICEVNMSSWQLRTTSNPLCGVTNNILAVGR